MGQLRLNFLQTVLSIALGLVFWTVSDHLRHVGVLAQQFHWTGDEVVHSEVIEVLAQTGRYAQWAAGTEFVPSLTTGPALMVPAAVLARVTGWSGAASGRFISVVYKILSLVALAVLLWSLGITSFTGMVLGLGVSESVLRAHAETTYAAYGVFGEGAGVFWLLVAWVFFAHKKGLGLGIAAGLALLSKPTFLIVIVVLGFSVLCRSETRRMMGPALLGFLVPWGLWIGAMLWTQGFSWTVAYWVQYPQVMRAVNGGGVGSLGFFDSILYHSQVLFKTLWKPRLFVAVLFCSGMLWRLKGKFPTYIVYSVLAQCAWWILISPGAEARYLLPAVVGIAVMTAWGAGLLYQEHLLPKVRGTGWLGILGTVLFLQGVFVRSYWETAAAKMPSTVLGFQVAVQEEWRTHTDWQAQEWCTSSESYSHDLEYTLRAPHRVRILPRDWPSGECTNVIVGENARTGMREALTQHHCKKISLTEFKESNLWGFWKCEKGES